MIKFKTIIARFAHAKRLINSPIFSLLAEEGREFFRRKYLNYGIHTGDFSKAHQVLNSLSMHILEGDQYMFAKDDPRRQTAADLVKLFARAKVIGLSDDWFVTSICLQGVSYTQNFISEAELKTREETTKVDISPPCK